MRLRMKWVLQRWIFVVVSTGALTVLAMILVPELFIFTEISAFPFGRTIKVPNEVEVVDVKTSDAETIKMIRLAAPNATRVAVVSHGSGGVAPFFLQYQYWLRDLGITSYGYDYRGYGESTGFPTEEGAYRDVEAVTQAVLQRENLSADRMVQVGVSLGTGFAAYAAKTFQTGAVILFSPYSSLPEGARERIWARPFLQFLKVKIPTLEYLTKASQSCVVVAHGKNDRILSYDNALRIDAALKERSNYRLVTAENGDHMNVLNLEHAQIAKALQSCWALH